MKKQTYIIAEAGVNHNGSIAMAKELAAAAAEAGADAVKFQTFKAEKIASASAAKAAYQQKATGEGETQLAMLKKLELPQEAYPELIACCREKSIDFLSTPFDVDSLRFLADECHVPLIKIPSGEITNAPFLLEIARTKLPVIMSTGMCNLGEIEAALSVLAYGYIRDAEPAAARDFSPAYAEAQQRGILAAKVRLLHCTTEYPAPFGEVNLAVMGTMRRAFNLPVGYSDHTAGIAVPLAAVARGAAVIEKHFTLDRSLPGPDHKASLEPDELKAMATGIRQIEEAIGGSVKFPSGSERANIAVARKSLVAAKAIKRGEIFTRGNVAIKRPGTGKSPGEYWSLLGQKATKDYEADELI